MLDPSRALIAQPSASALTGSAEASGNFLYGSASQRVFTASAGGKWTDRRLEVGFDAATGYGDARDQDTGTRKVIVRNSRLGTTFDAFTHSRFSPFALGSVENSFQQRIATRVLSGAGSKYTIWLPREPVKGFSEDASVSVALLDERTVPLKMPGVDTTSSTVTRTRYSVRARYRRQLTRQFRISHATLYQPTVGTVGRYTMDVLTQFSVPLSSAMSVTLTHRERIDSEARSRGALSNRDGQLLFGVRTTF